MASLDKVVGFMELVTNLSLAVTKDTGGAGSDEKNNPVLRSKIPWETGTGADQADQCWHDRRTLAASGTENLDFQAGTVNTLGKALALTIVKGIYFSIESATGGPLLIGGHATNALGTFFGDDTDKLRVRGMGGLATKDATGYAVAAGDLLTVVNEDGVNAVTYDILVVGVD